MSGALLWIADRALWIAAGLAVWVAVAAGIGVWLGRTARGRDRQIPHG